MDRFVRTGAVVAASLVATLALTACGSDGDGDGGRKGGPGKGSISGADSGSDSDSGSGSVSGSGPGPAGKPGAGASKLEGTWAGLTDGKAVMLSVASGKVALVAEQDVCQGDVKDQGKVLLTLKCADGGTERTTGSVESDDGTTVVVSWDAGIQDTLTRTDGATPPPGLPTLPTP
ncbi:hypothetical protein [Streptomyces sp. NPDC048560]|uniref:hypothetical protein n=1 Tax=Streptomyces sp. NPDC048560 TaxID=3155488 RepID=UPI00343D5B26